MCKAFSCVMRKDGKLFWKTGLDSHEDIINNFKLDDKTLASKLCRIEYSPTNEDYVRPDTWVWRFDNSSKEAPEWWKKSHDNAVLSAFKVWKKSIYSKIRMKEVLNPIHPFKIKAPRINASHIRLVKNWVSVMASVGDSVWDSVGDSVWDSVGGSVRDSVGVSVWVSVRDTVWGSVRASVGYSVWDFAIASVRASVGGSVWASVWDSVWASVWDSVWAYIGSLFILPRKAWKYTEKIKTKDYPFQPAVDLWKKGLVPVNDGKKWSLYGSKKGDGKCEKLWEEKESGGKG